METRGSEDQVEATSIDHLASSPSPEIASAGEQSHWCPVCYQTWSHSGNSTYALGGAEPSQMSADMNKCNIDVSSGRTLEDLVALRRIERRMLEETAEETLKKLVHSGNGEQPYNEASARLRSDIRLRQEVCELQAQRDAETLALQRAQRTFARLRARLAYLQGNEAETGCKGADRCADPRETRSIPGGVLIPTPKPTPSPGPSLLALQREAAHMDARRAMVRSVHQALCLDAHNNVTQLLTAARLREVMRLFLFYPISVYRGSARPGGPGSASALASGRGLHGHSSTSTRSVGGDAARTIDASDPDRLADGSDRLAQLSGICSIAGIPLPASGDCTGVMPEVVCTVLGSAAHLLDALGAILNAQVPHPVRPFHRPECAAVGIFRNGDLTFLELSPMLHGDDHSPSAHVSPGALPRHVPAQKPSSSSSSMPSTPAHTSPFEGPRQQAAPVVTPNPEFRLAVSLLGADVIYLCLQLGIPPSSLFPEPAVLLNLHVMYRHLLRRAQAYRSIMRSIPSDLSERALQEYYSHAVSKVVWHSGSLDTEAPTATEGTDTGSRLPPIPPLYSSSDVARAIAESLTDRYSALAAERLKRLRGGARKTADADDAASDWLFV